MLYVVSQKQQRVHTTQWLQLMSQVRGDDGGHSLRYRHVNVLFLSTCWSVPAPPDPAGNKLIFMPPINFHHQPYWVKVSQESFLLDVQISYLDESNSTE